MVANGKIDYCLCIFYALMTYLSSSSFFSTFLDHVVHLKGFSDLPNKSPCVSGLQVIQTQIQGSAMYAPPSRCNFLWFNFLWEYVYIGTSTYVFVGRRCDPEYIQYFFGFYDILIIKDNHTNKHEYKFYNYNRNLVDFKKLICDVNLL
jgi:hypothetical protein